MRNERQGNEPRSSNNALHSLNLPKRICEFTSRYLQRIYTSSKQEIRRRIESIPEEQITNINLPTLRAIPLFPLLLDLAYQNLHMSFKNIQIANPILYKLRANQLAGIVPLIKIRGEDTVAKEILPIFVKRLALPIIRELRRENGLDVFGLGCEDAAQAAGAGLHCVAFAVGEESSPGFEVFVLAGEFDGVDDEVDVCNMSVCAGLMVDETN
jgi:hypothetical protein